jgi:hypothetical protein
MRRQGFLLCSAGAWRSLRSSVVAATFTLTMLTLMAVIAVCIFAGG